MFNVNPKKLSPEQFMEAFASHDFLKILNHTSEAEILQELTIYINELIDKDFEKLVFLLYRIDVDEFKLKKELEKADKSQISGSLIAQLMLDRQLQKKKFRETFAKMR